MSGWIVCIGFWMLIPLALAYAWSVLKGNRRLRQRRENEEFWRLEEAKTRAAWQDALRNNRPPAELQKLWRAHLTAAQRCDKEARVPQWERAKKQGKTWWCK